MVLAFLAVILAAGTQLVFSPKKVSGWVYDAVSKLQADDFNADDFKIEFEKAQTTILGSISYPLGIRIKNFSIEVTKNCKVVRGKFDTVVLPFHFMKATRKEVELGLVRLSGGHFSIEDSCAFQVEKGVPVVANKKSKAIKTTEKDIINFFTKVSNLDMSFVKGNANELRFEGLLIYDLSFKLDEEKELLIDRFKVLLGSAGELVASGEWNSKLISPEGIMGVMGNLKISDDLVKVRIDLKEKEGKLSFISSTIRNSSENDEISNLSIKVEDFPLSIIARFKKFDLSGINLRKTWIDLDASFKVFDKKIFVAANEFKAHGDFGDLELGRDGLQALWTDSLLESKWIQSKRSELKLSEISLEKIITIKSKKKARGVFSEFGKFNAFLKFENLNTLSGDFETKDFSILFRSMGKTVYQKAKHARGKLGYTVGESLFFILDEVELIDGDFEGFIRIDYSYGEKILYTKFDIPHFRLNPKISKDLFKINFKGDLRVFGEGQVLKTAFTEEEGISKGNLQFMLRSQGVGFSQWGLSGVEANCGLNASELKCSLTADSLNLSVKLSSKAKVIKNIYRKVKSTGFSYKDEKLLFNLENTEKRLSFDWTKDEGLAFYPNGYDGVVVKTRDLD